MITLYISDIKTLSEEKIFQKYYKMLDVTRQKRVTQCKDNTDRKRSLLAGYLIQAGVRDRRYGESGLQEHATPLSLAYSFAENGKPYLIRYPGIYFNISHSGEYVVCAVSEEEVGVDIQEHREVNGNLAMRFFSEEDKLLLASSEAGNLKSTAEEMFFRIWTVKEAYMKLTGLGMKQGLDTTVINFAQNIFGGTNLEEGRITEKISEKNGAYFRLCDRIERYSIALCDYSEITDIEIKRLEIQ